jgi:hypothetical protein
MRRVLLVIGLAAALALVVGWFTADRLLGPPDGSGTAPAAGAAPAPAPAADPAARKIRASLFYVSEDGTHLVTVPTEVPLVEDTAGQARAIVEAQLAPAPPPYSSALPSGTSVRAVFVTDQDEAYVDLSLEATVGHTGGSLDEIFSVYTIVNAVTVSLPAIERVQILVDGQEVDSLAGHVDLRRPLPRNLTWVAGSGAGPSDDGASPPPAPGPRPAQVAPAIEPASTLAPPSGA